MRPAFGLVLLLSACVTPAVEMPDDVRATLVQPESFQLLSLHPYRAQQLLGVRESFYTYPVLGTMEPAGKEREELVKALFRAIQRAAKVQDTSDTTFVPRHGIRARRAGETVDVLISFEGAWLVYYRNGAPIGGTHLAPDVRASFDQALQSAGVRLP